MDLKKILNQLDLIERLIIQTRDLLFVPLGIRITLLYTEDISIVELWENELAPRLIGLRPEKVDKEVIIEWLFQAIGAIPLSKIERVPIEILSDIPQSEMPENTRKAIKVFGIKFKHRDEYDSTELVEQMRRRYAFINHMQGGSEI